MEKTDSDIGAKILIVEDDPNLLKAYSRTVSRAGYEILQAASGAEALKLLREAAPDLILLDAVLPDADGAELCRQIKENAENSVFVMMISGTKVSPDYQAEILEGGADGFLQKPIEPKVLVANVRAMLRLKKAEKDLADSKERYRRLAEELKETNQHLEEYNRLKAEFIANMSHELRTPLTAIIGFAQLMQIHPPKTPLPAEAVKAFERILRNGKHLLSLIDEVLDIAKIEAGRMKLHAEHFDPVELTQDAFAEMQSLAEQKNLDYRLNIHKELPLAYSDPVRIRQIMHNLLSNAIKFTPQGKVEVELQPHGDKEFRFAVRDTGIGIDDKSIGFIFERFRQVDGTITRSAGGTGLGLSIVKQIAELLGGRIEVKSEPGKGSEFAVILPLFIKTQSGSTEPAQTVSGEIAPAREPLPAFENGSAENENAHKPLVLIVEDDLDLANLLNKTVTNAGYRAQIAESGAAGLQAARQMPDLAAILLDAMMPGMDGWRVLQSLKSERRTAEIPVIVCSIVDNRPLGYRLGASNYLVKPIEPQRLVEALESVGTNGDLSNSGYVLVVDDEHGIRELLINALEKAGFVARSASSGETALKLISQIAPQAVLTDLIMPGGMTGFELIARMRANPQTENVPVIVITGKDMTAEDRKFIAGEIADVIRKGDLLMSDLETRLRQTLEEIGVNPTSDKNTNH